MKGQQHIDWALCTFKFIMPTVGQHHICLARCTSSSAWPAAPPQGPHTSAEAGENLPPLLPSLPGALPLLLLLLLLLMLLLLPALKSRHSL